MKRFLTVLLAIGLAISLLGINGFADCKKEKKQENFRIKFFWQSGDTIAQPGFKAENYNLFGNWDISHWFGKWWIYANSDYYCYLVTFTELGYKAGNKLPLHQTRRVSGNSTKSNLGIEAEVRLWKNLWLGGSYLPSPVFNINTVEEEDVIRFGLFEKIYEDPKWHYYEYFMMLNRYSTIEKTNERFSSKNFQLYTKYEYEFGTDLIRVFAGIGLDFWHLKRRVEKERMIYWMMPWTGEQVAVREEKVKPQINTDWYVRTFILAGSQIHIIKNLNLGAECKVFLTDKYFDYPKPFLIKDSILGWRRQLNSSSLSFYLSFGF